MIQNIDSARQEFLTNLQTLQERMTTTQAQVSSGYRVSKPSDDPAALGDILQLESESGRATQVVNNLGQVSGSVNTAESALENATQLLDQAASLGAQAANTTATAAEAPDFAGQAQQILSQLVSSSQTTFAGAYVFGGDNNQSPSYKLDPTSPNGVNRLSTSSSTSLIQDSTGVTFAVAKSAEDIFDHRNADDSLASDNVFAAVNGLKAALANNDPTAITAAIGSIHTAQNYLAQQLAFYGGVQNSVTNATNVAQKFQLQAQTSLGVERDTDMATAAVALTQEQTNLQVAIQAEAALPKNSLFDYLQGTG
jgi:flagellar hook-associated protein 3 FlgL